MDIRIPVSVEAQDSKIEIAQGHTGNRDRRVHPERVPDLHVRDGRPVRIRSTGTGVEEELISAVYPRGTERSLLRVRGNDPARDSECIRHLHREEVQVAGPLTLRELLDTGGVEIAIEDGLHVERHDRLGITDSVVDRIIQIKAVGQIDTETEVEGESSSEVDSSFGVDGIEIAVEPLGRGVDFQPQLIGHVDLGDIDLVVIVVHRLDEIESKLEADSASGGHLELLIGGSEIVIVLVAGIPDRRRLGGIERLDTDLIPPGQITGTAGPERFEKSIDRRVDRLQLVIPDLVAKAVREIAPPAFDEDRVAREVETEEGQLVSKRLVDRELQVEQGEIEGFPHHERVTQHLQHIDRGDVQVEGVELVLREIGIRKENHRRRDTGLVRGNVEVEKAIQSGPPSLADDTDVHRIEVRLRRHEIGIVGLFRAQLGRVLADDALDAVLSRDDDDDRQVGLGLPFRRDRRDFIRGYGGRIELRVDPVQR